MFLVNDVYVSTITGLKFIFVAKSNKRDFVGAYNSELQNIS